MSAPQPPSRRVFTYDEALATFPAVRDFTAIAQGRIQDLFAAVDDPEELDARRKELEGAVQEIVGEWAAAVTGLGCQVKGLWLVDWDCGGGYYCWKFPEETVGHFHGYDEGFAGRVPIA
jgi:hypothetical protein